MHLDHLRGSGTRRVPGAGAYQLGDLGTAVRGPLADGVDALLRQKIGDRNAGHGRVPGSGTIVSPWPPSTNAWMFSTDTFSSIAMNARMRAESSTPAMPMTRSRGNPLRR